MGFWDFLQLDRPANVTTDLQPGGGPGGGMVADPVDYLVQTGRQIGSIPDKMRVANDYISETGGFVGGRGPFGGGSDSPSSTASTRGRQVNYEVPGVSTGGQQGGAQSEYQAALRAMASGQQGAGAASAGAGLPALQGMRDQLDAEYGSLLGRLDQMYQTAQTPQEAAMIEFALADLDDQYRAAQESIGMVFDAADQEIGMYADRAADTAAGVGDMVQAEYDTGVERSMRQEAMARALLGEQFGDGYAASQVGAGGGRAALDASLMADAGTRESGYRQSMADMSAEDAAWLEAQQGTLRSANTAEASRIQAALRGNAIREHDARVSDRINAERMARAAAEQQLIQQKLAQQAQLASQEATMRAAAQQSSEGNRLAALQALADLEAAGGGAGLAFGDLSVTPVDGRVGPAGAWDADTFRNIMQSFQTQVANNDPSSYFSERQRAIDALMQRAPAPEGEQAALYEQWLNAQFDAVAPSQYAPYRGSTGSYTQYARNAPRGGR